MAKPSNVIVGLDIGTTKICCIIGEINDQGGLDVIGIGTHPSKGLRKGVVVNIESTVESIKNATEEAELMSGFEIESVYVGIAGGHIKGFNSHGVIAVKNKEISEADVNRVIDAAKAVAIPMDREVIHVIPQEYIVDDQDGIKTPLGMSGVRLEAKVHIVTGAVTSAQNIVKSVTRAGLRVNDIVLEQFASSKAVLSSDEKELGVAMIDIGGGTSDLAIFFQEAIKHTSVLAIGGNHVTNDIAIGLRTPTSEAERIKKEYGCALMSLIDEKETIEVPSVGDRENRILSRHLLSEIIEPRLDELFTLIKMEIAKSGHNELITSGIVLTGGSAIMAGMVEVAEKIFELPVRRGIPKSIGGLIDVVNSPMYATAVGLLFYGMEKIKTGESRNLAGTKVFNKVLTRMKEWMDEYF
ncbi:MAG TPA: cell division protein FtsA [Nitrospinota bacterium]|nr:cell division protein FtsA [Nitrospinota bacterium]